MNAPSLGSEIRQIVVVVVVVVVVVEVVVTVTGLDAVLFPNRAKNKIV